MFDANAYLSNTRVSEALAEKLGFKLGAEVTDHGYYEIVYEYTADGVTSIENVNGHVIGILDQSDVGADDTKYQVILFCDYTDVDGSEVKIDSERILLVRQYHELVRKARAMYDNASVNGHITLDSATEDDLVINVLHNLAGKPKLIYERSEVG